MTTTTALDHITAINTHPDDDTPRLVYADWLDEHAGTVDCFCKGRKWKQPDPCHRCNGRYGLSDGRRERAELIRVQCELTAIGPADTVRGKGANLRRRERELWGGPDDRTRLLGTPDWMLLTVIPSNMHELPVGWRALGLVYRGFVEEIRCAATDWLRHADALAWEPWVTDECPTCKGNRSVVCRDAMSGHDACPRCVCEWCDGTGSERVADAAGDMDDATCRKCDGRKATGRVPRPCPPTAEPIRKVTLTTCRFDEAWGLWERQADGGYRSSRWPWIEFTRANQPT